MKVAIAALIVLCPAFASAQKFDIKIIDQQEPVGCIRPVRRARRVRPWSLMRNFAQQSAKTVHFIP